MPERCKSYRITLESGRGVGRRRPAHYDAALVFRKSTDGLWEELLGRSGRML